jgi:hypothetical protein
MTASIAQLEPFVGEWVLRASIAPDLRGRAIFEWSLGGAFLLERSEVPDSDVPAGLCIVAADGDAYTQHYFDSRGVVRLYAMTFVEGAWTLLRTQPDFSPLSFSQRYTGAFSDDLRRIDGQWETSHDGGMTWELDFELTYERA